MEAQAAPSGRQRSAPSPPTCGLQVPPRVVSAMPIGSWAPSSVVRVRICRRLVPVGAATWASANTAGATAWADREALPQRLRGDAVGLEDVSLGSGRQLRGHRQVAGGHQRRVGDERGGIAVHGRAGGRSVDSGRRAGRVRVERDAVPVDDRGIGEAANRAVLRRLEAAGRPELGVHPPEGNAHASRARQEAGPEPTSADRGRRQLERARRSLRAGREPGQGQRDASERGRAHQRGA